MPRSSSETIRQVEGGSDNEVRYSSQEPLPPPPKLEAGTANAPFLEEAAQAIQPAWGSFLEDCRVRLPPEHDLNSSSLHTELLLVMNREGAILEVRTSKASGNTEFDQVAQEIAHDLGALPAPPPAHVSDDERFYLRWSFARDVRQAGPATAAWQHVELPLAQALPKLLVGKQYATATERILAAQGAPAATAGLLATVATAIVEQGLANPEARVQTLALHAVGQAKLGAFLGQVRVAVRSTEPAVALAAIDALAEIGDRSDSELLVSFAHGASAMPPAASAASALAANRLGRGDEVRARAIADLRASENAARSAALAVLSVLSAEGAVARLSAIVAGGARASRTERTAAALALGQQAPSSSKAVKALLAGTAEKDAAIRNACTRALATAAHKGLRSRVAYWRALELLKDKDERVRAAAVHAAAGLDPTRFGNALQAIRTGGSKLVLQSMAEALGAVPGTVALGRLLDLAASPDAALRTWAANGLVQRSEVRAAGALAKLLADEAPEVRLAAMVGANASQLASMVGDASSVVQAKAFARLVKTSGRVATSARLAEALMNPELGPVAQLGWVDAWLGGRK